MFENIESKLKALAYVILAAGIAASLIGALVLFLQHTEDHPTILAGAAVLLGGGLLSWTSSALIYGFAQHIEDTLYIRFRHSDSAASLLTKSAAAGSMDAVSREPEDAPDTPVVPQEPTIRTGWKCPRCGKINYSYVDTCECGGRKYDNLR